MRVILDANVYLSGIPRLHEQDTPPRRLLALWMEGSYDLLISEHIIEEVVRNMRKPYFAAALRRLDGEAIFFEIRAIAEIVSTNPESAPPRIATHPEDDYVLASAIEGNADFLVTGDKQLQRLDRIGETRIVSPATMMRILEGVKKS